MFIGVGIAVCGIWGASAVATYFGADDGIYFATFGATVVVAFFGAIAAGS
jgi:hypothetical protein